MIATSARSVRRPPVRAGTIGLGSRGAGGRPSSPAAIWPTSAEAGLLPAADFRFPRRGRGLRPLREFASRLDPDAGSVINFDVTAIQDQPPRVVLVHQRK